MFKLPGYESSSAARMRQNPPAQIAQKKEPEEVDSADDLEDIGAENVTIFNKIPESQVKQNQPLFLNRAKSELGPYPYPNKDNRSSSPFREKNFNNHQPKSGALTHRDKDKDDQTEAIRKMIYTKSPKEAAYEYISSATKPKKKPNNTTGQPKTSRTNDSPNPKSYPYPFNSLSVNSGQENYKREDHGSNIGSSSKGEASAYSELANRIYADKFHKNSQARRMEVGTSPESKQNLLLSMKEALSIEERKYFASKGKQDQMTNRLVKEAEIKNQHKKALANSYLNKEQEECTFTPRILTGGPRRKFDQFLNDQKQFQSNTDTKKKALQEQIKAVQIKEEGSTFKPNLCPNSVKMVEKKKRTTVSKSPNAHERLYNIGKNAHTKMMRNIAENGQPHTDRASMESSNFVGPLSGKESILSQAKDKEEPSFIPTIDKRSKNIKRNERIDNLLYSDAMRRQTKAVETSRTKPKSAGIPALSMTSKKAIATRFIKEFDIGILEFLDEGKGSKLNYLQCNEFLRKLRFLKESEQFESPRFTPERLLLYDMWYILYGDRYHGIHRRNLLVFLLAVLNLHFPITKIQRTAEEGEEDGEEGTAGQGPGLITDEGGQPLERKVAGFFDDDGNYFLTEEDVRKINQIYNLWHVNRLCASDNIGQLISARSHEEHSHIPIINESSRSMAQTYREKMLEGTVELIQNNIIPAPKDGKLSHADLLIVSKKVTEEKVHRYSELMKEEKSKEYTFKPQTTHYEPVSAGMTMRSANGENNSSMLRSPNSKKPNPMPSTSLGKDRAYELYSLAKPRVLKKDKDAVEVDFEKNYEECTFTPNIYSNRSPTRSFIKDQNEANPKAAEKVVDRLRTAQVEKEHQRVWKERGFSTGGEGHFVFSLEKQVTNKTGPPTSARRSHISDNSTYRYLDSASAKKKNPTTEQKSPIPQKKSVAKNHNNQREREENTAAVNEQQQFMQKFNNQQQAYGIEHYDEFGQYEKSVENMGEEYGGSYQVYQEERQDNNHQISHENPQRAEVHDNENEIEGNEGDDELVPLLFVDVNLGQGRTERIVVHEGDQSEDLAIKFCQDFGLDPLMKSRLKELLDSQMAGLLTRIEEEGHSNFSETDRRHHVHEEGDYRRR